jgi:integrase
MSLLTGGLPIWWSGVARPAQGPGRIQTCQGVRQIFLQIGLLELADRALLTGPIPLDIARQLAIDALHLGLAGNEDTVEDTITCVTKFFRYARDHGVEYLDELDAPLIEQFINMAAHRAGVYWDASPSTKRDRRWKIKEIFTTLKRLGLWNGPVLFGEQIPSRCGETHRPLTDGELQLVRSCSYRWLLPVRRPIVVALSEAGGSAGEIAEVELADVDLTAGTVSFRAGTPRVNRIPGEALTALHRALADGAAQGSRVAVTDSLDKNRAKRSVTQELSEVMRDAGLSRVTKVSGRSIRLHHALAMFDRDGIGAAARFLGNHSLDTTMRSLGLAVGDV